MELHYELKQDIIKRMIFGKIGQRFKTVLLNKKAIEKAMREMEMIKINNELDARASNSKLKKSFLKLSRSSKFQLFINICIVLNTIVLAFDHQNLDESASNVLEKINLSFYCVFVVEMVIKLIGLGIKFYFSDKFNAFDLIIVLISTIDVGLSFSSEERKGGRAFQALRAFRLLRVFKLAKSWKQL